MMNNKYLEIIMENIIDCILTMKSGGQFDYRRLFEAWVLSTIPAADRRLFIGPFMSLLVRQREVPFDFAFLDRKRYNPSKSLAPRSGRVSFSITGSSVIQGMTIPCQTSHTALRRQGIDVRMGRGKERRVRITCLQNS